MIPTAGTQRIKRETTAQFEFEEDGRVVKQPIRVLYYARSLTQIRANHQRNTQFALDIEERERLRKAMIEASTELDTAKAALAAAPKSKGLVAQQAVNDATRKAIEATNAYNDKLRYLATIEPTWLSTGLIDMLAGLPDLEDPSGDGSEFKITVENLETLDVENLTAINLAIEEALSPKDQPSK